MDGFLHPQPDELVHLPSRASELAGQHPWLIQGAVWLSNSQQQIHPIRGSCRLQAGHVDVLAPSDKDVAQKSLQVAPVVPHKLLGGEVSEVQHHCLVQGLLREAPHVDADAGGGCERSITDCHVQEVVAVGELVPSNDLPICSPDREEPLLGHLCHQSVHQRVVGVPVCGVDLAQNATSEGFLVGGDEYFQRKG